MNGIKLTATSYAILGLVDRLGEATARDLKLELRWAEASFWPVPHTTFYAEPKRLTKAGYLTENQGPPGPRLRRYRITERGRQAFTAWVASSEFKPPRMHDEQMLRLFLGADPVPLLDARLEWHRAKQAELERDLMLQRDTKVGGAGERSERALVGGIAYHRALCDAIKLYMREGRGS